MEMTDCAAEAVSMRRIPRDAFEAELSRRYIESDAARWYCTDEIKVRVGEEPDEQGAYDLYIWEPLREFDFLRILETEGEMRGKVWLAENPHPVSEAYRVQVWHEIEGREANYGSPPIPHWPARR